MIRARQAKDFVEQVILTIVGFVVCSLPFDLYLLLKHSLDPQGFWQNLVLAGFGVYFLGSIQVILLVLFIWWLFVVWTN